VSPFDKWVAVVVATITPLTGRAVAIPLGVGLGLPAIGVCVAAGISNVLLAAAIILVIERLEQIAALRRYIEKKRGRRIARFIQGKGLAYAVVLGPLVLGTFTVVLVFQALGTDKKRMLVLSMLSAIILTPLIGWVSLEYKNLLGGLLHELSMPR
jgi:nicotinamide riboside transporter PnuC